MLETIGNVLVLSGVFMLVIGAIGLMRFPNFFSRLHAVSVAEGLSVLLIVGGLLLHLPEWEVAIKLLFIFFFSYLTSPIIAQVISQAAYPREKDK